MIETTNETGAVMKKGLLAFIFSALYTFSVFSQSSDMQVYWDNGLKFGSKNGAYKISAGGRIHYDLGFLKHSEELDSLAGKAKDKVEVRRARLSFEGILNDALAYEFEFTFGETLKYADMYFAFLRVPFLERVTVGHFREPFGMEELTSSNAIVFMERSLTSAFGPSRNAGIMLQKQLVKDKLRAYAGVFRITDDLGSDLEGASKHSFSSRLVSYRKSDTAANRSIHLGAAFNTFSPTGHIYQLSTENEAHTSPAYIKTGKIENTKRVSQAGVEFGFTKKKWCVQSEYIHSFVQVAGTGGMTANNGKSAASFYAMASYFLKGGTRNYSTNGNRFSSISLTDQYEKGSMSGAWEIGLRLSQINLYNFETEPGRMSNATLAVNWYFNSRSRIMMNYILTGMSKGYTARMLQFRIQLTF